MKIPRWFKRSLDYAVSGKVRNQDAAIQFAIALQNDENRDQAWKYIQNNWDKVQAQLTTGMGADPGRVPPAASAPPTPATTWRTSSPRTKLPAADQSLKHALEHIDGCIELRTLQEPSLEEVAAAQPKP